MKIGVRIFVAFFVVVCLCIYFPLNRIATAINVHYREAVEDTLVDQANILAAIVEQQIADNGFADDDWQKIFSRVRSRPVDALIYKLHKKNVDSHIYITDKSGVLLFDSERPENVGANFIGWRDVALTLQGKYGARSSRVKQEDKATTKLYVAAPIRAGGENGEIVGVLAVVKPTTNIIYFVDGARANIGKSGLLTLAAAGLLSFLATIWLTRPIARLTAYAKAIRDGGDPSLPRLDGSEIGDLGEALAEMRETLEGKRYVEQYVQHLTHEIKSPLSAIRGAAELLGETADAPEAMGPARRKRFIANIENQSRRIQEIVDRMLELAALESPGRHIADEEVSLKSLAQSVCAEKEPFLASRKLRIKTTVPENAVVRGDAFLLRLALSNLVQNAAEFSPESGLITVAATRGAAATQLTVSDQGPGIPEFAEQRVFEKFFSLQRPHTGQKSTGLGLNFVMQAAKLHGGTALLRNHTEGGAEAVLELPNR